MASRISPEQQADLNAHLGQPVPLEGEGGNVVGYMIDVTSFLHMQGLTSELTAENDKRLRAMIQEGLASLDIPAAEVFLELRERVKQIKQANA